jgi:multiple antibiotic resistance protein
VYFSFRFEEGLIRLLGKTGTLVMMRLSAFILMCVGVQIITNGIIDVFHAVEHR